MPEILSTTSCAAVKAVPCPLGKNHGTAASRLSSFHPKGKLLLRWKEHRLESLQVAPRDCNRTDECPAALAVSSRSLLPLWHGAASVLPSPGRVLWYKRFSNADSLDVNAGKKV